MNTITITKLYEILSSKVGKDTAENLTSYIEQKIKEDIKDETRLLATREDISNVREEIYKVKTDMIKWYVSLFILLAMMIIGLYLK